MRKACLHSWSSLSPGQSEITSRPQNAEQPKLLLVDDNKEMLQAMGAMLESQQVSGHLATSAAEALHHIDTKAFNIS